MTEVDRPAQEGEETTGKQFKYEEVTVWAPLTANKITQKVLTSRWDSDYEQKLVNEYNSAQMRLLSEEEAAKKIAQRGGGRTQDRGLQGVSHRACGVEGAGG